MQMVRPAPGPSLSFSGIPMKTRILTQTTLLALALTGVSAATAQVPSKAQDQLKTQDMVQQRDQIHAYDYMTQRERDGYMERMRAARNEQERERIRAEHREQMEARIRAMNQTMKGEPGQGAHMGGAGAGQKIIIPKGQGSRK